MPLVKIGKYWHIHYYDNGRRIRKSTGLTNKSEARKILKILELKRAAQKIGIQLPIEKKVVFVSISQYLDIYLENNPHYAPGTIDIITRSFSSLIQSSGDIDVDTVTVNDVKKFKAEFLTNHSGTTFNIYLRQLSTAWKRAMGKTQR